MYALVLNDVIQSVGRLPRAARRLDTGQWVVPHAGQWTDAQAASCGYLPVVEVARPADTATHTAERTVELVNGVPTVVWTAREWTAEELAARTAEDNRTTIRQQAEIALANNRTTLAAINTQLGEANPTTVAGLAVVVRALLEAEAASIRQRQGIIRLILDRVDGLD